MSPQSGLRLGDARIRYCFCSLPESNCPVLLFRLTTGSEVTSRDYPSLGSKWDTASQP